MFRKGMTERDAITISAVLGFVVLLLILLICRPFTWGDANQWPQSVNKGDIVASQSAVTVSGGAVSGGSIFGTASGAAVSGSAFSVDGNYLIDATGDTLETRVLPPEGYERTSETEESLSSFLRTYEMKKDGAKVKLHDGNDKVNQEAHVAVFKLPIEEGDLQQCADSVMRVYAEYFWKNSQFDKISFSFVDGFQADYIRWREGYRIQLGSTQSSWVDGGTYDDSYANFQKYMRMVFAYSSTISLKNESKKIKVSEMQTGDIFLESGSPGHVVMIVDVCENEYGQKAYLLAQGFMPAQEFHVLKNPAHEGNPWYYEEEIVFPLQTPEFTFNKKNTLRRLQYMY